MVWWGGGQDIDKIKLHSSRGECRRKEKFSPMVLNLNQRTQKLPIVLTHSPWKDWKCTIQQVDQKKTSKTEEMIAQLPIYKLCQNCCGIFVEYWGWGMAKNLKISYKNSFLRGQRLILKKNLRVDGKLSWVETLE